MTSLLIFLTLAIGISFLCSIAEAVLLSVTPAYIRLQQQRKRRSAEILTTMKADLDSPLAAILTLNTVAHTVGAAGVGAEAAKLYGDNALGIASAIMTLLILVLSEIIPKTLGGVYWRELAPMVAYFLKYLVRLFRPFIWLSKGLTGKLTTGPTLTGFNREEFAALAELGEMEGELTPHEASILQNVFKLRDMPVKEAMTPAVVIFSMPENTTVDVFFHKYGDQRFSRIPVYGEDKDHILGFVLRTDLLKAKARDNGATELKNYKRDILVIPDSLSLLSAFEQCLKNRSHMMAVVNEYGDLKGLITLEDIIESLMGLEIVDEQDKTTNLQKLARSRWLKKARQIGVDSEEL